jgi:hypothetical protein
MRLGIGRGGRGECVGVLTMGGDEGKRPEIDGQRQRDLLDALRLGSGDRDGGARWQLGAAAVLCSRRRS